MKPGAYRTCSTREWSREGVVHRAHAAGTHGEVAEGALWRYELKWDGYRAIAFKHGGKVSLRSRNDNDFSSRYAGVTTALSALPEDTVIDGEIVALDEQGKPSFNVLQNYGSARAPVLY